VERATDVLKNEHRGIERMLAIVDAAAAKVQRGEDIPANVFERAIDFARGFTDKCHHAKEERHLFPALEERGIPRQGPIGVMLAEHAEGRRHIVALARALEGYRQGDNTARTKVAESSEAYTALLRSHILKEDNVLFPMADSRLSEADQKELAERFEQVEREEIGEGVHERYHRMIEELERELNTGN
jgi:hemerythrin-like domain-containing protein